MAKSIVLQFQLADKDSKLNGTVFQLRQLTLQLIVHLHLVFMLCARNLHRVATHQSIFAVHLFVEFRVQLLHNILSCCLVLA